MSFSNVKDSSSPGGVSLFLSRGHFSIQYNSKSSSLVAVHLASFSFASSRATFAMRTFVPPPSTLEITPPLDLL
jgi:hypothetical protein